MKKFKLCLVALATFFLGAQSVSAASEITSGTSYYIQNVGSGLYLCGANSWGTQASVSVQGEMFTPTTVSDGVYTLTDEAIYVEKTPTNKKLGSNLYTDNAGCNWTIEAVGDGSFTIKNDNGYIAQSATAGSVIGYVIEQVASVTDAAKWHFLTKEEAIAKLNNATMDVPVDASFLIGDANFGRNHSTTAWTQTSGSFNMAGGNNENMCAESWKSAFDLNQTLTGIPNGVYKLTAQAALSDYAHLYDGTDYPNVYAGDQLAEFKEMEEADRETNMSTLSTAFTAGKYQVNTIEITVTDQTLKFGVKGTRTDTWCIWDNFQLKYYGVDLTALKENLAARIEVANKISGKMNATVSSDLTNAISAAENCAETQAAIEEATTNLNNAITAANESISDYASVPAVNEEAAKLDAAGIASYASTLEAYNNNTLKDLATAQAAYQTAVKAQTTEGADMTGAITNWDFTGCSNNNFPGWTISANGGNTWKNGTTCVEYWNETAANGQFDYSQVITGLPKGKYQLTAKMWNSMNNVSGTFAATSGVYGKNAYDTYTYGLVTDDIDNGSMKEYSTGDIFVTDDEGTLTVGVKNSTTMVARWFGVDYIKLTYLGEVDINSFYTAIADLLTTAKAITDPQTATATALATAISNANGYESNVNVAALQTIQADLSAAVTASQASVKAYANAEAALPEMKKLVDATNVYTAEALETYYTTPASKYEAKTLTTEEAMALQNPATVTGWHAAITCDNFLLSAWDTKPDFTKNDSPYYINSWSTEGSSDLDADGNHSGFNVPFFEYWTGDDASLGEKTLTATIPNLEVSDTYEINALVRVRIKDSSSADQAKGITFQANDGDAVNVCDGTEYSNTADNKTSYFFIKKVTTHGMVDMQGNLKIKFNVASDNNISWLSFKDVTYTKKNPSDFWFEYPDVSVDAGATKTRYCETSSTGAMTIVSNDENIATAEYRSDGNIVIKGIAPGTTTIDVTQAADATHVASGVVTLNVTVNATDITETLTYTNNGSLCYDYDATVSGSAEVYEFGGIYESAVYGTMVNKVEAGKPYIVLAGDLTLTRTKDANEATNGSHYNGFYGVAGNDAPATGLGAKNYIFYQGNLYYANNSSCSKGHGYFVISEIPSGAPTGSAKALFSLDLDEATGINAINGTDANATIYNIAGQRVNNAKSGLFIINGKKVVK